MPVAQELALNLAGVLARNWWVLMLRGIVAILFGILSFALPAISLAALVLLFGAYCLADGLMAAWTAVSNRRQQENGWLLLMGGLLGIGVGLLTIFQAAVTALALVFYVAIWAIGTGVVQVLTAIRLRQEIQNEWMLILAGLASLGLGALLLARPGPGALALLWLIASYAIVFGLLLVVLALEVRGVAKRIESRLALSAGSALFVLFSAIA
jgi:uncharacterized membrane protein HdeD (DUF308 family)